MSQLLPARLRLFSFTAAQDKLLYLRILRAMDQARERYTNQLGVVELAEALASPTIDDTQPIDATGLRSSLDQLVEWGILSRTQDSSRVKSIAEYRLRRSTYQFTSMGWRAFRAVEGILYAKETDAELKRLVLPTVLEDLRTLSRSLKDGDGERCYLLLDRIHGVLTDLAEQAGRFYIFLAELDRLSTLEPSAFLNHKERLITHLESFLRALQQHRPQLSAAVEAIEVQGTARLIELVTQADDKAFEDPTQTRQRWEAHWIGVRSWFLDDGGGSSKASQLDIRTTQAIRGLAAILRRLSDAHYGGFSRASQLRDLAKWFNDCPSDSAAHGLFSLTFGLSYPRHLSLINPDSESAPLPSSWWAAPPAPVSTTLREHGKSSSPGRPASLKPNIKAQRVAKERHKAQRAKEDAAKAALLRKLGTEALTEDELRNLLAILSRSLQGPSKGPSKAVGSLIASHQGKTRRLTLRRAKEDTVLHSTGGRLVLKKMSLELSNLGQEEAP